MVLNKPNIQLHFLKCHGMSKSEIYFYILFYLYTLLCHFYILKCFYILFTYYDSKHCRFLLNCDL